MPSAINSQRFRDIPRSIYVRKKQSGLNLWVITMTITLQRLSKCMADLWVHTWQKKPQRIKTTNTIYDRLWFGQAWNTFYLDFG